MSSPSSQAAVDAFETIAIETPRFTFPALAAGPRDGQLVLLLHGFPETGFEWRHQLHALADAGYRAVAPDQRGYAKSARPSDITDYGVLLLAQDVIDMADALGAERFHVVGHDWGGGIAWTLGRLSAERVASLTVVSTPHPDAFNAELRETGSCQHEASAYFDLFTDADAVDYFLSHDRAKLKAFYECADSAALDAYLPVVGQREGLNAALNWYRANIKQRVFDTPELGKVMVPTLYVWGDEDPVFCRETAERSAQGVGGSYRFEALAGAGHYIPECAPERFNPLLLDHLQAQTK